MKPRVLYPKITLNATKNKKIKNKLFPGAPIKKGAIGKNVQKAQTIHYLKNYCRTPKIFYRRKEDREFHQLLNAYFNDYNKFHKKYIIPYMPQKEEPKSDFDINQYELKKKNISSLFFNYDLKNVEDYDFYFTDNLINTMYNGDNDTIIKNMQIKNDYEIRLNGNKRKEIKINNFMDNDDYNDYDDDDHDGNKGKKRNIVFNEEKGSGTESSNMNKKKYQLYKVNEDEKKNEEDNDDQNIFYLQNRNIAQDDNFLNFKTNIYFNTSLPLFSDIIKSNFNENYDAPIYEIPQSVLNEEKENQIKKDNIQKLIDKQKEQPLNKYKDGELKRFKDIIIDNQYPGFEQLINPYYQTNYKPPPCFPKLPEDEEEEANEDYGYEDFGFNEDDNNKNIEEDDNFLILLNDQITNKDFPMFEHLIRNDFKGNYAPPTYKIPSHIQEEIKQEKEKKEENKNIYEKNKRANVENEINQYDDGELKMLNNIIKDDKYPLFEQVTNPYYQTKYIPPQTFPKTESFVEAKEEDNYGYGDFELNADKEIKGNDNDNVLVLVSNTILNNEYPMFENLIKYDFKGNYAPPYYKMPDSMKEEEKVNNNEQNFKEMRGKYINYDDYQGRDYPTVDKIINNNEFRAIAEEKKETEQDNNKDEDYYNDFE